MSGSGRSTPLMSTSSNCGERCSLRYSIAFEIPPRMIAQCPSSTDASCNTRSVPASTNAISGNRPAASLGAISTVSDARRRPDSVITLSMAARSVFGLDVLAPKVFASTPGGTTEHHYGLGGESDGFLLCGPKESGRRIGRPFGRDGFDIGRRGRNECAAQRKGQLAEFSRDIDEFSLIGRDFERHSATKTAVVARLWLCLDRIDRQHTKVLHDRLTEGLAGQGDIGRDDTSIVLEILRQDDIDPIAGRQQSGAGSAGGDRERNCSRAR